MDISIVTVGYKSRDFLREQLRSVFASTGDLSIEVFVVDNNSNDGTVEMVRTEFPHVTLIANQENLGFAKANNQAIRRAIGRYVLLLNPDMRVFENTLSAMVAWMDAHPKAGVSGCRLVTQIGENMPHVRRFPRLWDQAMILLKIPHLFPGVLNQYLQRDFDYSQDAVVDSIRGSFFMIRRDVLDQLGSLDERYFIWFEEVDYCRQVSRAGWDVMYTVQAKCIDYVGQSFALVSGVHKQKMFTKSMVSYFRKWHPISAPVIIMLRPIAIAISWLVSIGKR